MTVTLKVLDVLHAYTKYDFDNNMCQRRYYIDVKERIVTNNYTLLSN